MTSLAIGITGAAGFIGRAVVARACRDGHRPLALSRSERAWPAGVLGQCLPADPGAWQPAAPLDAVVHLACDASVRQDLATALATHVTATHDLLRRCAALGVRRFVYVSSVAVFGLVRASAGAPTRVGEDHPRRPTSAYGLGKMLTEELVGALGPQLGLETVIARPGSVYGPGMHEDSVLPAFLRRVDAGADLTVFGDGRRAQDFVHVDDVAQALVASCAGPAPATFNLGSGEATTLRELAEAVVAATGARARVLLRPDQPDDGQALVLDVAAARRALGYAPRGLRDGLKELVAARGSAARSPSAGS